MPERMRALIIDDEALARENLQMLVEEFCPEVEVLALAANAKEARTLVEEYSPDLVFLDIMMPGENGFAFLEDYKQRKFAVIFTTAHGEHAMKALKVQAVDYLEKPINIDDLQDAVAKAKEFITLKQGAKSTDARIDKLLSSITSEKTAIPTSDGLAIVKSEDIIHLEAYDNYTTVFLINNKKIVSSKNIKLFEDKLSERVFFRTHRSHIINFAHHLTEFKRTDGNIAVMSDNTEIPISRRKLPIFLERIAEL